MAGFEDRLTVEEAHQAIIDFIHRSPNSSFKEVAAHFQCHPSTVYRVAKTAGIRPKRLTKIVATTISIEAQAIVDTNRNRERKEADNA